MQIDYQFPPQAYLTQCQQSQFNGSTYGDIVEHLILVTQERDLCAGRIHHIRQWVKEKRRANSATAEH